jgi:hypothetical protein
VLRFEGGGGIMPCAIGNKYEIYPRDLEEGVLWMY